MSVDHGKIRAKADQLLRVWGKNATSIADRNAAFARQSGDAEGVAIWEAVRDALLERTS